MKGNCVIAALIMIGLIQSYVQGKPNGAPDTSCFYMTPRHIHPHTYRKVYPSRDWGMYNISVSNDYYRPDIPVRVTIWGPEFKGFMMVAAEEGNKDWPTGIFYSENNDAKTIYCLGRSDTVTHRNNSGKTAVEVLWYGPETTMANNIQFIATIVVNLTTYYTAIKSGFITQDPTLAAAGENNQNNQQLDPWLSGQGSTGTGTGWVNQFAQPWSQPWGQPNLNTWNNVWGYGNAWLGDLLGMDGLAADGAGGKKGAKKGKGRKGAGGAAKGGKKTARGGRKQGGRQPDPQPNPLQTWWDMLLAT